MHEDGGRCEGGHVTLADNLLRSELVAQSAKHADPAVYRRNAIALSIVEVVASRSTNRPNTSPKLWEESSRWRRVQTPLHSDAGTCVECTCMVADEYHQKTDR